MLYEIPECGPEEDAALARIHRLWNELRFFVASDQKRWMGSVRRVLSARANQGSNSIEGYNVSTEDAIADLQGAPEPQDSDWEDWQANQGYRRAMTYVLHLADDSHFDYGAQLLRSLHFMMVEHDLSASPGRWRPGPIWVQNELTKRVVYNAPECSYVPGLVDELINSLQQGATDGTAAAIVRAAMAHLNFVLIHPFRDGNGRMARCLQSLVLVREGHLAREFCSIEEFLGVPANQQRYYAELERVAQGQWTPENDARSWVRFCIEAHYVQAESVLRRVQESEWIWARIDQLLEDAGLNQRCADALFDASLGLRVRNASYRASLDAWGADISAATATADLRALVDAGLLVPKGAKRGAYYLAAPSLVDVRIEARSNREPLTTDGLFDPLVNPELPAASAPPPQPELFPIARSE